MRKQIFEGIIYTLGLLMAGICLYVLTIYRPVPGDVASLPDTGPFDSPQSFPVTPMHGVDEPYPIGRPDGTFIPPRPVGEYQTEQAIRSAAATATGPSPTPSVTPTPTSSPSPTPCVIEPIQLPQGAIPNGALVVWSHCGQIWKLDDSGSSTQLAAPGIDVGIEVSPDRKNLAFGVFTANRLVDLYVLPLAGGETRKVLDGEALDALSPPSFAPPVRTLVRRFGWLPDSSGLAFKTYEDDRSEGVYMGLRQEHDDLWYIRLDHPEPLMILDRGMGGTFAFSPDGRKVALTKLLDQDQNHRLNIAVANVDGSERRDVYDHPNLGMETDGHALLLPHWTADSSFILALDPRTVRETLGWNDDSAYFDSPTQLIQLGLDGSRTVVADAARGSVERSWEYNAAWSPSGDHYAFLEALPSPSPPPSAEPEGYPAPASPSDLAPHARLVIAEREGKQRFVYDEVTAVETMSFDWSPDGKRMAFLEPYWDDEGHIKPARFTVYDLNGQAVDMPRGWPLGWLGPDHILVQQNEGIGLYHFEAPPGSEPGAAGAEPIMMNPIALIREFAPYNRNVKLAPAGAASSLLSP